MRPVDPGKLALLKPGDIALDRCGIPERGALYLDLPRWFVYSQVVAAAVSATQPTVLADERKQVDANAEFYLTSVYLEASVSPFRVRLQWPSGRYSSQIRVDTRVYASPQTPRSYDPPIPFPAGSWIGIELENRVTTGSVEIIIVFGGYNRYYLTEAAAA